MGFLDKLFGSTNSGKNDKKGRSNKSSKNVKNTKKSKKADPDSITGDPWLDLMILDDILDEDEKGKHHWW